MHFCGGERGRAQTSARDVKMTSCAQKEKKRRERLKNVFFSSKDEGAIETLQHMYALMADKSSLKIGINK
jgi:hypothetical protein